MVSVKIIEDVIEQPGSLLDCPRDDPPFLRRQAQGDRIQFPGAKHALRLHVVCYPVVMKDLAGLIPPARDLVRTKPSEKSSHVAPVRPDRAVRAHHLIEGHSARTETQLVTQQRWVVGIGDRLIGRGHAAIRRRSVASDPA